MANTDAENFFQGPPNPGSPKPWFGNFWLQCFRKEVLLQLDAMILMSCECFLNQLLCSKQTDNSI